MSEERTAGVYAAGSSGEPVLVHAYLNENYGLADIAEMLQYGEISEGADSETLLTLTRKELRDVSNEANAFSFDYDEGFVEMCLDIARVAAELPGDSVIFSEVL